MHIQRQQENFAYRVAANPVRDLIHYTYPNHVPEIMANGFHAGRGEGGYGVYFTPAGVDYPDLNYGEHVPIHAQFQPTKTLMMTGDDGDPGYQKYVEATYKNYHRPDIPLAEQGYDSVEYHDRWGATQFIVLDPTKIKTIGPIGPESPHYTPPRKIKSGNTIRCAADLIKDYTDSLYKEFHDWIDNDQGGVWPVGGSRPADYTQGMGGPLSYWDNIEAFLEDRYPAVHRGYRYGEEQVAPTLDGYGISFPRYQRPVPYETGPEAVSKYGYDPRQVAAGFMYLHSTAHNTARPTDRADRIPRDIDRLSDIFQKRVDMQEDAKQRKLVNANIIRMATQVLQDAGFDPDAVTSKLRDEFNDWASNNPDVMNSRSYTKQRGPIAYWPYIEDFLKERYPAAYRGERRGQEDAGSILHYPEMSENPYETGPEAVAEHGYDPAEVAAGMLFLHNDSHPLRGYTSDTDIGVLTDIVQKRTKMQRAYENAHHAIRLAENTIRCATEETITLYHHTNPEAAAKILAEQRIRGSRDLEGRAYFSNVPNGLAKDFGNSIVQVEVPVSKVINKGQAGYGNNKEFYYQIRDDDLQGLTFRPYSPQRLSSNTIRCAMPTLYHHTKPEAAESIQRDRKFSPTSKWGDDVPPNTYSYFTDEEARWGRGFGPSIVRIDVPDDDFDRDFEIDPDDNRMIQDYLHSFPDDPLGIAEDTPYRVESDKIKPEWIHQGKRLSRNTIRCATPQRFTRDWQHIGFDYMPTDVLAHYMVRKDENFGDEKNPQYERAGRPPLSQQIQDRGYEHPVELCTDGRSGYIQDGHHRIDLARQRGQSHVPVVVTWRQPDPGYPASDNKIEPWLKSWLTDMRRGRQTASKSLSL